MKCVLGWKYIPILLNIYYLCQIYGKALIWQRLLVVKRKLLDIFRIFVFFLIFCFTLRGCQQLGREHFRALVQVRIIIYYNLYIHIYVIFLFRFW